MSTLIWIQFWAEKFRCWVVGLPVVLISSDLGGDGGHPHSKTGTAELDDSCQDKDTEV